VKKLNPPNFKSHDFHKIFRSFKFLLNFFQRLKIDLKIEKRILVLLPPVLAFIFIFNYASEGPLYIQEIENIPETVKMTLKEEKHFSIRPSFVSFDAGQAKGIYLTMWTATRKERMEELLKLIDETEINSVVIDVKGSQGELIYDIWSGVGDVLKKLHDKNIYVIARVVAFQDSGYAKTHPELALKRQDGGLWRDRRGFVWLDPAAKGSWDHIVDIAKKAIDLGFDEIQYDYIRFPTDGNLSAIVYPAWDGQKPRSEVLKEFFAYSREKIKDYDSRINLSIDIFGYTFLRSDDLGIGQILADAVDYFDYISPMVYPSHYSAGNFGFDNPADHPYEVVKGTLDEGLLALGPIREGIAKQKTRPWLQVFDMGARYDSDKIKAQIQAVYDAGGTGWLLWDPNNRYNGVREAVEKEGVAEIK